jgi:hypothetical protein
MATKKNIPVTNDVTVTPTKKVASKKAASTTGVKKAATKKVAATKKPAAKKTNKRELVVTTQETAFWVNNGEVLYSLVDLRDSLQGMTARVYRYHADYEQHDFALWVEHVLGDAACAAALRAVSSVTAAEAVVIKHLKRYTL